MMLPCATETPEIDNAIQVNLRLSFLYEWPTIACGNIAVTLIRVERPKRSCSVGR